MINMTQKNDDEEKIKSSDRKNSSGWGIAVGLSVGCAMGLIIDNVGMGIAIGISIGIAIDLAFNQRE